MGWFSSPRSARLGPAQPGPAQPGPALPASIRSCSCGPVAGITEMEMEERKVKTEERENGLGRERERERERGRTNGKREKAGDIMCGSARRWETAGKTMTNISSEVRRRGRRGRAVCMEGSCYCKPTTVKSRLFIEAPSGHQKWDFNAKLYFNPFNIFHFVLLSPDEEALNSLEEKFSIKDGLKHIRVTRDVDTEELKCLKIHIKLSTFPRTRIKSNEPLTSVWLEPCFLSCLFCFSS